MRIAKFRRDMGESTFDSTPIEDHISNFSKDFDEEIAKDAEAEKKRSSAEAEKENAQTERKNSIFFDTIIRPLSSPEDNNAKNNSTNPFTSFNQNATQPSNSIFNQKNNQQPQNTINNNSGNIFIPPNRAQSHSSIFNTNSEILSMDGNNGLRNKHKNTNTVVMTGLEAKFHKTKSVSNVEEDNPWKTVKSSNPSNAWNKRTSLGSIDAAFGTTSIPTTVKSRYRKK